MKILSDKTVSTKQLPKSHLSVFDSHQSPSKLNIKLKTHSLTCLDVPLETCIGFQEISSSFNKDYRKSMTGSFDLSSEIPQHSDDDHFPSKCFD